MTGLKHHRKKRAAKENQVSPKCLLCRGSQATLSKPAGFQTSCITGESLLQLPEIDRADDGLQAIMLKAVTEQHTHVNAQRGAIYADKLFSS